MYNGWPVVDAVVHPYSLQRNNWPDGTGLQQMGAVHERHCMYAKDPAFRLAKDEYLIDFPVYGSAHALFAESAVDMAIIHALPNLGFTRGPVAALDKMIGMRDRWPGRFLLYGCLDTPDIDAAIKSMEMQVRVHGIKGLKLYPAYSYNGEMRGWSLDDPSYGMRIVEAARDLGIRNIAIHKAVPFGAPIDFYKVGDLESPLREFRDVNIQLVHAGYAFLEETRILMDAFPNLIANIESTMAFAVVRPRAFAKILGEMLYWASAEQIVFSSGLNIMHPQPLIEALAAFEMPADLMDGLGFSPVTDDMKAKMLGGNMMRMHGLSLDDVLQAGSSDEFSRAASDGLLPPWSGLRKELAS